MKKVIDGKVYNEDTAELIGYRNDGAPSDARYVEEALYRTKKGAFFLSGSGGPFSVYGKRVESMWACGEDIVALTEDEARAWLETYGDAKAYFRAFGEPEEA
jgi:hypothetical protein